MVFIMLESLEEMLGWDRTFMAEAAKARNAHPWICVHVSRVTRYVRLRSQTSLLTECTLSAALSLLLRMCPTGAPTLMRLPLCQALSPLQWNRNSFCSWCIFLRHYLGGFLMYDTAPLCLSFCKEGAPKSAWVIEFKFHFFVPTHKLVPATCWVHLDSFSFSCRSRPVVSHQPPCSRDHPKLPKLSAFGVWASSEMYQKLRHEITFERVTHLPRVGGQM